MATNFAGEIFKGAQELTDRQEEQTQGMISTAVGVAEMVQKHQQQKQAMEQKQKEIQQAKISKFGNTIIQAANIKDPSTRRSFLKNFVPKQRDALGLTDQFPDESLDFAFSSEENLLRVQTLAAQVRRGDITEQEAYAKMNTPDEFIKVTPEIADVFTKASESFLDRDTRIKEATAQRTFKATEAEKARAAKPQTALDVAFAKDVAKFNPAALDTNIKSLAAAKTLLENPGTISDQDLLELTEGTLLEGMTVAALDFFGGKGTEAVGVRDDIRKAVQSTLKETLGAQFTEKEAKQLFERAFRTGLSDKENARRVGIILEELTRAAEIKKARVKYFQENNGTLKGFPLDKELKNIAGRLKKEFLPNEKEKPKSKSAIPGYPGVTKDVFSGWDKGKQDRFAKKNNMTVDEIKKRLGAE